MAGIGAFISPGKALEKGLERVRLAESLGFDSVYTTHIAQRDSLAVLSAYAAVTERVRLGTGVLPIFSRTPVSTAQTAATIDEQSGGRMVLGLGVSHKVTVENWFDSEITKPVTQMREYASIVRAILDGETPPAGEFFNTRFAFMGYGPFPDLPIYIAALSPNMLKLAGELGDGVMLWLCNPDYIRDVVMPAVAEGRERAGKTMEGFDVVAAVPVAVADDREGALARMRQDLIPYASLPFYRSMLERSGFEADIAAFDEGMAAGDPEQAKAGLSDALLDSLAGIGDAARVKDAVERYRDAGAISPCVGGIPGTDYDGALKAVAELI
jgi:alkanesulfonate monooxygenase SsuD/methylene tetrahydromethanopterin reductase-like flavin-dependent oxidoreductase (luciferase family)